MEQEGGGALWLHHIQLEKLALTCSHWHRRSLLALAPWKYTWNSAGKMLPFSFLYNIDIQAGPMINLNVQVFLTEA